MRSIGCRRKPQAAQKLYTGSETLRPRGTR
jgi:hypothetical protein